MGGGDQPSSAEHLRVLADAMRAFAEATTEVDRLIDIVAARLADVVKDGCMVFLLADEGDRICPAALHGNDETVQREVEALIGRGPLLLSERPLAKQVLESGEPFVFTGEQIAMLRGRMADATMDLQAKLGVHSLLLVPMRARGKGIGTLFLARFRPESPPYGDADVHLARNLADHAALAIANARSYAAEQRAREAAERTLEALRASTNAHAEVVRAKALADAANLELEAFSYAVAHDLRAPLRAINGFAEVLAEATAGQLDDEAQQALARVLSNTTKMGSLIDGLLALSRVGRGELHRQEIDVGALAKTKLASLAQVDARDTVEVVISPDLRVEGDPALVTSLLDNLLDNAWKFTSKTPKPRIEVGRSGDALFVRDNGAGFDTAYAARLFAPFQRLHPDSEFPGTGIGLATVQRIANRHGGRVWAESARGAGATFFFQLGAS